MLILRHTPNWSVFYLKQFKHMSNSILTYITLINLISQALFIQSPTGLPAQAQEINLQSIERKISNPVDSLPTIQKHLLIQSMNPQTPRRHFNGLVTAYSSTPDQTDDTPFITASGTHVHKGTVACNFLPFGTRLQFPELFGTQIFIVEDRMAPKNSHKIDIWFPTRQEAKQFGVKRTKVLVF